MSKVKKIVSLMLAAVMVLSVAPFASAYVYDASQAGDKYSYDGTSTVTNPTPITVDTYETTETIRICDQNSGYLDGTYITSANSAGIAPISNVRFTGFAYGNDPPTDPVVVLRINGISDTSLITNLNVATSQINGFNAGSPAVATGSNYIKYTWTLAGNKTWSVPNGNNTGITYNITFTYAKKAYTAHAYATAKYIVRPNGVMYHAYAKSSWFSGDKRSAIPHSSLLCAVSSRLRRQRRQHPLIRRV